MPRVAWDEWEQLKSDAKQRGAHMQLNQLAVPDGGGGAAPTGDLTVSQEDLKAVGDAAYSRTQTSISATTWRVYRR